MYKDLEIIVDYLEEKYKTLCKLHGENDEKETLPCKKALEAALNLMK